MKALTIHQPYAELIAKGEKFVENRAWKTNYRGPLAIHAGKSREWFKNGDQPDNYLFGAVIAVGNLVACLPLKGMQEMSPKQRIWEAQLTIGDILQHSHTQGPYCWIIKSVSRIEPIFINGNQGLWNWSGDITLEIMGNNATTPKK